jgi:hypothetical protein
MRGSEDSQRSKKETDHNMVIKDAMRATNAVKELFETWHELLKGYATSIPELAKLCLSVMEEYICWVDISFVFNQNFISLFYSFLKSPALREETCACLEELVSKGMDKRKKLQLMQQLNVVTVMQQLQIDAAFLHDDENEDFAEAVASLVGTQWEELLECMNEWEDAISNSGRGLATGAAFVGEGEQGMPPPSPQEVDLLLRACGEQLTQQLPLVWLLTRHPNNEISKTVFPILNSVLVLLQKNKDVRRKLPNGLPNGHNGTVHFDAQIHVSPLLTVVVQKMRYPEDFDWGGEGSEEEAEVDMYRCSTFYIVHYTLYPYTICTGAVQRTLHTLHSYTILHTALIHHTHAPYSYTILIHHTHTPYSYTIHHTPYTIHHTPYTILTIHHTPYVRRRELRKLWVNLVRTAPDESMAFLCTTLATCLHQHAQCAPAVGMTAALLELEVCFTLLHAYGEGRKVS